MQSIRFRILAATLAITLGAAIAKSQTAEPTPPPPPMHGPEFGMDHHMIEFYSRMLDITDTQKAEMKATLQKEHAAMQPLMEQMRQLDTQLKQYAEGTYDPVKVPALVSQQSQTLVQLKVEETRIHSELYQMLTPEQQAKLKEFEANRQARVQQRMQENAAPNDSQQ